MCGDICMEMIYDGLHTYRKESYISKDLKERSYGLYTVLHASHKAIHLKMTSACLSCSWEIQVYILKMFVSKQKMNLGRTDTCHMM